MLHQNDFFPMIKLRVSAVLCLEHHPEVKVDFASFLKFPWCQSKPIALCLCVYLGLTHSSKDTLDLILSLSTSATCQGTEWIKPWAKARCSEAEKRPAPAGSLFLMVSLDKLGMLDKASLYSLQILTLKSIIALQSKFGRALPDTEPVGSTAVGKKEL